MECFLIFQSGFSSPPPTQWRHEGIFLQYLLRESGWAPTGKTHKKGWGALFVDTSEAFNSQTCPHSASAIYQLQFKLCFLFFVFSGTPLVASAGESLLWKTVTPYTCLSVFQIWRQQFAGYPPFSHRSRKSFGFFNLLSFNLLLGHSGDFQALYKRNEKPEIHIFWFKVYLSLLVFNCNIVF